MVGWKGDLEIMKKEISTQELVDFKKDSAIMTVFFLLILITPIPLAHFLGWWGMAVQKVLLAIGAGIVALVVCAIMALIFRG